MQLRQSSISTAQVLAIDNPGVHDLRGFYRPEHGDARYVDLAIFRAEDYVISMSATKSRSLRDTEGDPKPGEVIGYCVQLARIAGGKGYESDEFLVLGTDRAEIKRLCETASRAFVKSGREEAWKILNSRAVETRSSHDSFIQRPGFPSIFQACDIESFADFNQLSLRDSAFAMLADLSNALTVIRGGFKAMIKQPVEGVGEAMTRTTLALFEVGYIAAYASTDYGVRMGGQLVIKGTPQEVVAKFQEHFGITITDEIVASARQFYSGYNGIARIVSADGIERPENYAPLREYAGYCVAGIDRFLKQSKVLLPSTWETYRKVMADLLPMD